MASAGLFLMRHGPAEDHAADGIEAHRALTGPGRHRVRAVARLLVGRPETFDAIVTSPLVRAVQTAEIVAETASFDGPVIVHAVVAAPGAPRALLDIGDSVGVMARRILVVGHEPSLSDAATAALGPPVARRWTGFRTAQVLSLDREGQSGGLAFRFIVLPDGPLGPSVEESLP